MSIKGFGICLFVSCNSYMWHVPLTYVFEDSPQDPKMTWMNISSDEGLLQFQLMF